MPQDNGGLFFRIVSQGGEAELSAMRVLTEVEAQFKSERVLAEVRWRMDALTKIANQPGFEAAAEGLRDKLTQVFTAGGSEATVLERLKGLTEIRNADGSRVDLRSFLKRDRRVLREEAYRHVLALKIINTNAHVVNLIAYYPEAEPDLHRLSVSLKHLTDQIRDSSVRTRAVKQSEDAVRADRTFVLYEDLKTRFLKDWLRRFSSISEKELEGMTPEEIQRLIQEHQRHQITALLKGKVQPVDLDMTEHLGLHDTLESQFKNEEFWRPANVAIKTGFVHWIMDVVQGFGMLNGRRHALFKSLDYPEQFMLFGLGLSHLPEQDERPIRMYPYLKPFVRKGTYLLEVRKRDIGDVESYHHELRHYTLPFLFAFEQMHRYRVRRELVSFFTSAY